MRFHGRRELFVSNYTVAEMDEEAEQIRRYLREGRDIYVYFNNDAEGHAVENARALRRLVERQGSR
jgi:uncharacterized protein YecE (DUF72 family)